MRQGGGAKREVSRATVSTPAGTVTVYGSEGRLMSVALPAESTEKRERWLASRLGGASFGDDRDALLPMIEQFEEYFAGQRQVFGLELELLGTEFQRKVWTAVSGVPYGRSCTYLDIARGIGQPTATRAVGAANGANPIPIVVPCHRIIGSNGTLTGYGGGLDLKAWLLELERRNSGSAPER